MDAEASYQFFRKFEQDNLSFLYQGDFNDELTHRIVRLGQRDTERLQLDTVNRKLSSIITECYQNVVKHRDEPEIINVTSNKPPMFLVRSRQNIYTIASANLIDSSKLDRLVSILENINSFSSAQLKEVYRKILAEDTIDDKGGAGLGLLEMARKSNNRFEYDFQTVNYYLSLIFIQLNLTAVENQEASEEATVEYISLKETQEIYALMDAFNILVTHKGDYSHCSIIPLLEMAELNLQNITDDRSLGKKIFYILIELLQNISKHAKTFSGLPIGIFLMSIQQGRLLIHTGNVIENDAVEALRNQIEFINNLDDEGLAEQYKINLLKSTSRNKGGAGLGLLDIARYSNEKIEFDFKAFDEFSSFFSLRVIV